jgi:hypothetical protein
MKATTSFAMPLNDFQRRALDLLIGEARPQPFIAQHPYVHPAPGDTNQYLTVEWRDVVKVWVYDDEIQVGEITFERPDYPSDDDQFYAMLKWVGDAFEGD